MIILRCLRKTIIIILLHILKLIIKNVMIICGLQHDDVTTYLGWYPEQKM